jgi:integrase
MASIRNREGKWQARVIRRGYPPETKTFESRVEATKWARGIEASIDAGGQRAMAESINQTLKALLMRYTAEVTPTKRGGVTEAIRIRAMARWKLAGYSMANLTAERVAAYRDERLKSVGAATVIRDLALLSGVINHARREWGLVMTNPCTLVRRPESPLGRDRVVSAAEEQRLHTALTGSRRLNIYMPFIVTLALETAMRRGELLAIRWENVDLEGQTLLLKMTKNGSPRRVPLSTRAVQALRDVHKGTAAEVFPITWMALERAFRRACIRANIPDLRFHDLRHTAASRIATKLPNLIELSAVTGHKTMQMLKRYYHPNASDLARKLG